MRDAVRETRAQAIITLSLGALFDENKGKAHIPLLWEIVKDDMGMDTFERIMTQLVEAEIIEVEGEYVQPLDLQIGAGI